MSCDPADECGRECLGCGGEWCAEEDASPGEDQGICRDCFETEVDDVLDS